MQYSLLSAAVEGKAGQPCSTQVLATGFAYVCVALLSLKLAVAFLPQVLPSVPHT